MPAAPSAPLLAMPELLRAALEEGGIQELDRWWQEELDHDSRRQVLTLWQDCAERHSGPAGQPAMEMRVQGTPEEEEEEDGQAPDGFWHEHFYGYLVNHEAYYFEKKMVHVCTAEAAARRAIESGLLAADFQCGIPAANCPIRRRVEQAGGRSIRLSLTFVPKPDSPAA